jgi:hypothetical protein
MGLFLYDIIISEREVEFAFIVLSARRLLNYLTD